MVDLVHSTHDHLEDVLSEIFDSSCGISDHFPKQLVKSNNVLNCNHSDIWMSIEQSWGNKLVEYLSPVPLVFVDTKLFEDQKEDLKSTENYSPRCLIDGRTFFSNVHDFVDEHA